MFKLPDGIPNLRSSAQDWADYAEFSILDTNKISLLDLIKTPLLVSDEIEVKGIEDDTDKLTNKADEIALEIRYRGSICKGLYPFYLTDNDYSLVYNPENTLADLIYRFLLLATRVNMSTHRIQANLDGALIFEELSAVIALNYFGDNAQVDILGTSKSQAGGFREKLRNVVTKMGEGGAIHQNEGHRPQDENVDLIVWKGFSDKLPSKMIAFGQCKTGTSWSDKLSELNTESFCKIWFTRQPVLTPVRLFFAAQYFPKHIWEVRAYEAGLVFDRFRIIDYLPKEVDEDLLIKVRAWVIAVTQLYK